MARNLPVTLSAEDRLAELPAAALMCRDLRHAWPRKPHEIQKLVELEPTVYGAEGRVVEGIRRMWCTGGCRVRRIETVRRNRHGRLERVGKARLKYPDEGYLLAKPDPGQFAEPVDAETLRDAVLRRMFPDLNW